MYFRMTESSIQDIREYPCTVYTEALVELRDGFKNVPALSEGLNFDQQSISIVDSPVDDGCHVSSEPCGRQRNCSADDRPARTMVSTVRASRNVLVQLIRSGQLEHNLQRADTTDGGWWPRSASLPRICCHGVQLTASSNHKHGERYSDGTPLEQ